MIQVHKDPKVSQVTMDLKAHRVSRVKPETLAHRDPKAYLELMALKAHKDPKAIKGLKGTRVW